MSNNLPPQFGNSPEPVSEKQSYPGFPSYETRTVSEQDAQKLDAINGAEKNNSFLMQRVGSGLFLAVVALFLPLLLLFTGEILKFLVPPPSDTKNLEEVAAYMQDLSATMEWFTYAVGLFLVFCVAMWAGAGVRCVWDMIKHYSALSGVGLFITFVTPVVWAVLVVVGFGSSVAATFAPVVG